MSKEYKNSLAKDQNPLPEPEVDPRSQQYLLLVPVCTVRHCNYFQLFRDKYAHTRSSIRTNKEHQILIYEIRDCLNETTLIQGSYHGQYPRALQHSVTIVHIIL